MHEVSYAGGTFVTSDEVAEVLIEYAAALANADRAASVDIPVTGLATGDSSLQLLVGPASQLMSSPTEVEGSIDGGEAFVAEMRVRIDKLQRGWSGPSSSSTYDWDL
jgi:hypothetical protein